MRRRERRSFKDAFSASGTAVVQPGHPWGAYSGFFGSERPGWRQWSSLAIRVLDGPAGRLHVDYKTGLAKGGVFEPEVFMPPDGKRHGWSLRYEPEARPSLKWPDAWMRNWVTKSWRAEEEVLALARRDVPDLALEKLQVLLTQARDAGLVENWKRKGQFQHWGLTDRPEHWKGRVTFSLDEQRFVFYLLPGHADEPTRVDRFGIFNEQVYSGSTEHYLADLVVNGHALDLSKDPQWEGRGNRATFVERDFHERQNFGYSETNWAGDGPGEIGGRFWSTEPEDPYHGYYAADVGTLTLDVGFAGAICTAAA